MANQELLQRISADPEISSGKPIVRRMRISVELILSLLAQGETIESILADYPDLEPDDIRACIAYAHAVIAGGGTLDKVEVAGTEHLPRHIQELIAAGRMIYRGPLRHLPSPISMLPGQKTSTDYVREQRR